MRVLHRLTWCPTERARADLLALGFDPSTPDRVLTLIVDEADSRWPAVRALAPRVVDLVETEASESERAAAAWLVMYPTGHRGYPQPEDDWAAWTYDPARNCAACGGRAAQRAPFRLRRDPGLRSGRVLQLNWAFDEYFTTPETWEAVFQPHGVARRPVVVHRTGEVLPGVVQLDLAAVPEVPLALGDHPSTACEACGRLRYRPYTRGFLPLATDPPADVHAVRSRDLFGSGGSTRREVLVSQALYQAVRAHRIRGCSFLPTRLGAATGAPVA